MANPFVTTAQVWKAIFLREALHRLFGVRAGWMWLIVEPAIHMAFLVAIRVYIRNMTRGGVEDIAMWLVVGLLSFFFFRRTAIQAMHGVDCNRAFFAFRQVRPFDAAFVRGGVDAFLMLFISLFILLVAAFLGHDALPQDPLLLLAALLGLCLIGLGYGLVSSVLIRLVPEMAHILQLMMMPLYVLSGVMWPLQSIPQPYRDWLLLNPLAHGLELVRQSFLNNYQGFEASLGYLFFGAQAFVFLGMALHRRFEAELVMQ